MNCGGLELGIPGPVQALYRHVWPIYSSNGARCLALKSVERPTPLFSKRDTSEGLQELPATDCRAGIYLQIDTNIRWILLIQGSEEGTKITSYDNKLTELTINHAATTSGGG